MSACENLLPYKEKFRRQHREWSDDPFENSPLEEFPMWLFGWRETNRCPECLAFAWYAVRGEDGGTHCPECGHRLPERWFTDKRVSPKEDTDER